MTDAELYNKAADLIEKGWTQQAFARDEAGWGIHPGEKGAVSWCLSGALWVVICGDMPFDKTPKHAKLILYRLFENLRLGELPARWNDSPGRTKGQVASLLRNTAARSRLLEG